jgi:signal transduction histidine kinase
LTLSQETQRMTKQGNLVDVRVITFPIRFQDGEISGIYIIYEDITAQKELEKQKMVARSLQGLDSLVDGLAHHFNNAFAVISGNAQLAASLLTKSAETGKVKKALGNIQAVIERIQDIAKTNTRLARFSNTDQQRMIRIRINDFMREFLLTRSLPADGDVDIRQELLAEGDVFADKGQLWEIMDNLLDNALESMAGITPPRQIIMRTEMIQVAEKSSESAFLAPGRYVKISVQDSGRGIPSQIRGNIFHPFFTTKGNRQGLGLALSYFLLKQYNGHIDFDSPAGGGSRFSIYLPEFGDRKP